MNKRIIYSLVASFALFGFIGFAFAQTVLTNPLPGVTDFKILLTNIAQVVGRLIGALGTIMIIVSAILYLTSAGSPEKMGTAKKALIYAIIGIAIGISAEAITGIILEALQNPTSTP